jgi:anti-sigma B factor antagonist
VGAPAVNIQRQDAQTCLVTDLPDLTLVDTVELRESIRAGLPPACKQLILDFAGQNTVDSRGLGLLVALHKTLRSRDGLVRLNQPTPAVRNVLALTRLDRIFEIVA